MGGLDCYVRGNLKNKNGTCVILLHGYGANGMDLYPLCHEIPSSTDTTWIFPEADISLSLPGNFESKAWYPIDLPALQIAAQRGDLVEHFQRSSALTEKPRKKLEQLLEKLDWPTGQLVLGGFSQGAMLATDLCLHLKESPKSLLLYSSALLNPVDWAVLAKARSGMRVLQSHGTHDAILPYELGRALFDLLKKSGLKGEFLSFRGGHEIPPQVLKASAPYL